MTETNPKLRGDIQDRCGRAFAALASLPGVGLLQYFQTLDAKRESQNAADDKLEELDDNLID